MRSSWLRVVRRGDKRFLEYFGPTLALELAAGGAHSDDALDGGIQFNLVHQKFTCVLDFYASGLMMLAILAIADR